MIVKNIVSIAREVHKEERAIAGFKLSIGSVRKVSCVICCSLAGIAIVKINIAAMPKAPGACRASGEYTPEVIDKTLRSAETQMLPPATRTVGLKLMVRHHRVRWSLNSVEVIRSPAAK